MVKSKTHAYTCRIVSNGTTVASTAKSKIYSVYCNPLLPIQLHWAKLTATPHRYACQVLGMKFLHKLSPSAMCARRATKYFHSAAEHHKSVTWMYESNECDVRCWFIALRLQTHRATGGRFANDTWRVSYPLRLVYFPKLWSVIPKVEIGGPSDRKDKMN